MAKCGIPNLTIVEPQGNLAPPDINRPSVQMWRDHDGAIAAYAYSVHGEHWVDLPGVGRFRFGVRRDGVTAIPEPRAHPSLIWDAYYRTVLPLVLHVLGYEVLHASATDTPQGIVAFCGASGAGKSTLVAALAQRGYAAVADDAVSVEVSGAATTVSPLPFTIHLRPASVAYFRESRPLQATPPSCGARIAKEQRPLVALCLLQRKPEAGRGDVIDTIRLPPSEAFLAVLTHAYCFSLADTQRKGQMVRHYLELISRIPVYEVRFEADWQRLAQIVTEIERLFNPVGG
jgi:hypothetical protein